MCLVFPSNQEKQILTLHPAGLQAVPILGGQLFPGGRIDDIEWPLRTGVAWPKCGLEDGGPARFQKETRQKNENAVH